MLLGPGTGRKLQLVTASGGAAIKAKFDAMRIDQSNPPVVQGASFVDAPVASITTAMTTDLVAGVASQETRVLFGSVLNDHASASDTVTLQVTDGTNTVPSYKRLLLPGELILYTGNAWQAFDANGNLYTAGVPQQFPSLLVCPMFATAALTGTKTITSNSCFAVYVGKATKAVSSAQLRWQVTTAMATITWGEVAIAKGAINPGGNPTLTVVGYADVSAVANSTGRKTTTINVASGQSIAPGDDIWVIIGNQATTACVVRAPTMADDNQVGVQASVASRPSTIVGKPTVFTIEGASTLAPWVALLI
mgnify:CR=1 FL=1